MRASWKKGPHVIPFASHVYHPDTGAICKYKQLAKGEIPGQPKQRWVRGFSNEFGRLANGVGKRMPSGTKTIRFINKKQIPRGKKVTYGNIICDIRPQKEDPFRVRLTVGGT